MGRSGGVVNVSDVTPAMLDQGRGSWRPDAEYREDRISLTTQAALLTRIKAYFRWATGMEFTKRNPTLMLKAITPDDSQTWPLNPKQFEELLEATNRMDDEARYESTKAENTCAPYSSSNDGRVFALEMCSSSRRLPSKVIVSAP
jgi:hypothetical protein